MLLTKFCSKLKKAKPHFCPFQCTETNCLKFKAYFHTDRNTEAAVQQALHDWLWHPAYSRVRLKESATAIIISRPATSFHAKVKQPTQLSTNIDKTWTSNIVNRNKMKQDEKTSTTQHSHTFATSRQGPCWTRHQPIFDVLHLTSQ